MNNIEKKKIDQLENEDKSTVFLAIEQRETTANILSWINLINIIVSFLLIILCAYLYSSAANDPELSSTFLITGLVPLFLFFANVLERCLISPILEAYEQEKLINKINGKNNNTIFLEIMKKKSKINIWSWIINPINIIVSFLSLVYLVKCAVNNYQEKTIDWIDICLCFLFFSFFFASFLTRYVISPVIKAAYQQEKEINETKV